MVMMGKKKKEVVVAGKIRSGFHMAAR